MRLVGMVHLAALPGSPLAGSRQLQGIVEQAVADAAVLQAAGFDAVIVQNGGDRPARIRVDGATVAQMSVVCEAIRREVGIAFGVCISKNDGPGSVAVAAATGATFVRIKVLTGGLLSAEGFVDACAYETLALRTRLGSNVEIWTDVCEPMNRLIPGDSVDRIVIDAIEQGAADRIIVTESDVPSSLDRINRLRELVGSRPLIVGGYVTAGNVASALDAADGVIVGGSLKTVGDDSGRLSASRCNAFVDAARRGNRLGESRTPDMMRSSLGGLDAVGEGQVGAGVAGPVRR